MVVKMKNITLLTVCCAAFILGFSLFQSPTLTEKDFGNKGSLQGKFYLEPGHRSYHNSTKRILQGQRGLGATPSAQVVIQVNETILVMIREIREKLISVNVSVKPFDIPCNKKSIDNTEDLLCMDPPKFDKKYKNPCWYDQNRLQCLPYFQVIGMDKCGSTDLFDRIAQHPDVVKNSGVLGKETLWWSWLRYGHWLKRRAKKQSFQDYLNYFRSTASVIEKDPSRDYITGDGTPMDLWDNTGWRSIPQNNGLREPRYITPHLIQHINPHVKFLIILRDPVERLFSDYFFLQLGKMTIEGFHKEVARIALGFYAIFLQDWFQVFPREQFLIIRTEDFASTTLEQMYKVFRFLDLHELPPKTMQAISTSKRKYVTKKKKTVGKMKPETRRILEELYGDFNQQLESLLNDRKFTWK